MRGAEVWARLLFEVTAPAVVVAQLAVARPDSGGAVDERMRIENAGGAPAVTELDGPVGGRLHLVRVQPGPLLIDYAATVGSTGLGAANDGAALVSDAEWVEALRPSRYCPSDRLAGFAAGQFGGIEPPVDRVRAICAYVHERVSYVAGASDASTDAVDTLLSGQGVCRDLAHLVATLCRAVDVPARLTAVYAPGLYPMDLHLVVETAIDGRWLVWDATRLAPRPSLVRIASGRDAADVAFTTTVHGVTELREMSIGAVARPGLPTDDHEAPVTLQ